MSGRHTYQKHSPMHRRHSGTGLDMESYARWLRVGAVAFTLGAASLATGPCIAFADATSTHADGAESGSASTSGSTPDTKPDTTKPNTTKPDTSPSNGPASAGAASAETDPGKTAVGSTKTDTTGGGSSPATTVSAQSTHGSSSDTAVADPDTDLTPADPAGGSSAENSTEPATPPTESPTTEEPTPTVTTPVNHGNDSAVAHTSPASSATHVTDEQSTVAHEPAAVGTTAAVTSSTQVDTVPSPSQSRTAPTALAAAAPAPVAVATAQRQAAQVSAQSIVVDLLHWFGLGSLAGNVVLPTDPIPAPIESLWLFVRQVQYTFNNQRASAAPTVAAAGTNGTITGSLNAVDYDDGTLSYAVTAGPAHGTVVVDGNGNFVYTPNVGTVATADTFTVTVGDDVASAPWHYHGLLGGLGVIGPRQVMVTVSPTGATLPTTGRQSPDVNLSTIVADMLHWVGLGRFADGLAVAPLSVPEPLASTWQFIREVKYILNNQRADVMPTITGQAADGTITGSLNAVDYDDGSLIYTVKAGPGHGTVTVDANGNFTYKPDALTAAAGGLDGFTVSIGDTTGTPAHVAGLLGLLGILGPRTASVSLRVNAVGPRANGTGYSTSGPDPLTGAVGGTISATAPGNGTLTYSTGGTSGAPTRGTVTVDSNTGAFTYTPTAQARHDAAADGATAADKSDSFSITVSDAYGGTLSVPVRVTITPANAAPTVGAPGTPVTNTGTGSVSSSVNVVDSDGDSMVFGTSGTTVKGGTVTIDRTTGAYVYTPSAQVRHDAAADGATASDRTDSFDITVSDGHGGTITVPVSVAISSANSTPQAGVPTMTSVDTGTGVVGGTLVGGSDSDGDTPRYSAPTTTVKGGTVTIDPVTGAYTYTPSAQVRHDAAANGATAADQSDSFDITISDGHGGTAVVPVSVTVVPHNTAPTAGASVTGQNSGTGVTTGTVAVHDADGDTAVYGGSGTTVKGGTVVVDPITGAFTYTPSTQARHDAAATGATAADRTDSFTVTVSDGHGGTVSALVVVNVAPANSAPTGGSATVTNVNPGTGVIGGSIVGGHDADGDTAVYSGPVTSTKGGTVTVDPTTGAYTYTPSAAIRHAASADGASVADRTDTFDITVSDGHGGTNTVPVTVTVVASNVAPVAGAIVTGLNQGNGVASGVISGHDADGDTTVFSAPTTSVKGGTVTVDPVTGAFTYTPSAQTRHDAAATGATGSDLVDSFTVMVSDGHGGTAAVLVVVGVTPTNGAPTSGSATVGTPSGPHGTVTGTVSIVDPDGDAPVFTSPVTTPKGGTVVIDPATGAYTYTPTAQAQHDAAAAGATTADKTDSFTLTVGDGHGGTVNVPVTVAIAPANAAPTASVNVGSPAVGGTVTGAVVVTDADGDHAVITGPVTTTKGGSVVVDPVTGTFTYTPTAAIRHAAAADGATADDKTDTFAVTVDDGHGGTIVVPVSVAVTAQNAAPTVTSTVANPLGPNGSVSGAITAVDPDGDTLVLTGPVTTVKGGTVSFDRVTGTFTYTPTAATRHAAAADGATAADLADTFNVRIDDGHGSTTTVAVTVAVAPANTGPSATASVGAPSGANGSVAGSVSATDPDGDTVVITGPVTTTKGGTVVVDSSTGTFTYTPTASTRHAASAAGATAADKTDTFTMSVADGHGGTTSVVVTVAVDPANSGPTAVANVTAPTGGNGAVAGSIVVTDADGDTPVFTAPTTTAKGGTVSFNAATGNFVYTPTAAARHDAAVTGAPASATTDTFSVTVADRHGGTVVVPVSLVIGPDNVAPTATANVNTFANGDFTQNLTGWTVINGRVILGGGGTVAGWPTPTDPTRAPDGGTESTGGTGTYNTSVVNGRATMVSDLGGVNNTPTGSGGVVHGPVVVSNNPLAISAGATVQFDWEASGGSDAFDVVGYIVDVDTGHTEIMLNATGVNAATVQPVTVVNYVVNTAGNYKFVFVSGTWDATKGMAAGAKLSIDNVKVLNNVNPSGVVNGSMTGSDANGDTLTYAAPASTSKGAVTIDPVTGVFSYTPTAAARAAANAAGATAADKSDTFVVTVDDGHGGVTPVSVTVTVS